MGKKIMSVRLVVAALRMLPHIVIYMQNRDCLDKDLVKYTVQGGGKRFC